MGPIRTFVTSRRRPAMPSLLRRLAQSQEGSIAPIFAMAMIPLLMALGIATDLSRAGALHASLQSTVDKAALSGAAAAFGTATQMSTETSSGVGRSVYSAQPLPVNTGITSPTTAVTSTGSAAATPVTVTATTTASFAPTFLSIWASSLSVTATATVKAGGPTSVNSNVAPYAIPQCVLTQYWGANGQPTHIGPSNPVTFTGGPNANNPDPNCTYGQWTSLTTDNNSASYTKGLITGGCGCTVANGDTIYIQPGAKASLYGDFGNQFDNTIVMMPVVSQDNLSSKTNIPVSAFVPFFVQSTDQGGKTITGYFVANYTPPGASGTSGAFFGAAVVQLSQ